MLNSPLGRSMSKLSGSQWLILDVVFHQRRRACCFSNSRKYRHGMQRNLAALDWVYFCRKCSPSYLEVEWGLKASWGGEAFFGLTCLGLLKQMSSRCSRNSLRLKRPSNEERILSKLLAEA